MKTLRTEFDALDLSGSPSHSSNVSSLPGLISDSNDNSSLDNSWNNYPPDLVDSSINSPEVDTADEKSPVFEQHRRSTTIVHRVGTALLQDGFESCPQVDSQSAHNAYPRNMVESELMHTPGSFPVQRYHHDTRYNILTAFITLGTHDSIRDVRAADSGKSRSTL
jgi:hypothetical protein